MDDVEFDLDGEPVRCPEGLTVAAALLYQGRVPLRLTPTGSPRGLFCGMGVCFDCAMEVDGRPGVRTCMTLARTGMRVVTPRGAPELAPGVRR